jgi:hypothetical protein
MEEMASLVKQIAALPGTDVDLSTFPSGAAMVDVRRDGHLYVLAYSPSRGFGVDEVTDADGFLLSYRFTYEEFGPAAARLWELVTGVPPLPEEARAWKERAGTANGHPGAANVEQIMDADPNQPRG